MSNTKVGPSPSESQQVDSLITDLLTALQPAFITHSKTAMDDFSSAFFSKSYVVTLEDALMLLTGDLSILRQNKAPSQQHQVSNQHGLLSSAEVYTGKYSFLENKLKTALMKRCGKGHSFGNKLRKSSEMSLTLQSQLVDPEYNTMSSHIFCKALAYCQDKWQVLRLAEHAQSSVVTHKKTVELVSNALERSVELFETSSRPPSPTIQNQESTVKDLEEVDEMKHISEETPEKEESGQDMQVESMDLDQLDNIVFQPERRKSSVTDLKAVQAYIRRNSHVVLPLHLQNNAAIEEETEDNESHLLETLEGCEEVESEDDSENIKVEQMIMGSKSSVNPSPVSMNRTSSSGNPTQDLNNNGSTSSNPTKPKPGGFRPPPPPPPPKQTSVNSNTVVEEKTKTQKEEQIILTPEQPTTTTTTNIEGSTSTNDNNTTPSSKPMKETTVIANLLIHTSSGTPLLNAMTPGDMPRGSLRSSRKSIFDIPTRQRQSSLIACDALAMISVSNSVDNTAGLDQVPEEGMLVAVHGGVPIPQTETNPFVRVDIDNTAATKPSTKPTSIGNTSSFFSPRKPSLRLSQTANTMQTEEVNMRSVRVRKSTPSFPLLLSAALNSNNAAAVSVKNTPITRTLLDFFRNRKPPPPTVIFGKSLTELHADGFCDKDYVPFFIKDLCTYIVCSDARCETEGLFRVNGDKADVEELKATIDSGADLPTKLHNYSPLTICAVLKLWFRSLPQPFFSREVTSLLVDAYQTQDVDLIYSLLNCRLLSVGTRGVLQYFMYFCAYLSAHRFRASSKLTPSILANVIAPNLAPPITNDYNAIARDQRAIIEVLLLVMQSVTSMSDVIKVGYNAGHDLANRIMVNQMEKEKVQQQANNAHKLQNPADNTNTSVFDQVVSKQGVFFVSDTGMLVADVSENILDSEQYHQQRIRGNRNQPVRKVDTFPIESPKMVKQHDVPVSDDKLLHRCKELDKNVAKVHLNGVGVQSASSSTEEVTDQHQTAMMTGTQEHTTSTGILSVASFFSPVVVTPAPASVDTQSIHEHSVMYEDEDYESTPNMQDISHVDISTNATQLHTYNSHPGPMQSTSPIHANSGAFATSPNVEVIKLSKKAFQQPQNSSVMYGTSDTMSRTDTMSRADATSRADTVNREENEQIAGAFSSFTIARVSVKPTGQTSVFNAQTGNYTRNARTGSGFVLQGAQDSSVHAKRKRKMMRAALLMGDYTPVMEAVNKVVTQSTSSSSNNYSSGHADPLAIDARDAEEECVSAEHDSNEAPIMSSGGITRTMTETSDPPPPPPPRSE